MIKPKPPRPSFCDKVLVFLMLISFVQTCAAHNRIRRQGGSSATDTCFTKDGLKGVCIKLVKCDEATKIFLGNPTAAERSFLRDRTCKFDGGTPFFCCVGGRAGAVNTPDLVITPATAAPPPPTPSPVPEQRAATLAELEKVCGISYVPLPRFGGCMTALLGAWPWMAAIFIRDGGPINTERVTCAGVVVSDFYVLTASHCVVDRNTKRPRASTEFLVQLGNLDVNSDADGASPVDFDVSEVIPHPDYTNNPRTSKNDIALIRLAKPAAFSLLITPICLPTADMKANKFERMQPFMAGWGDVKFRGKSSSILKQVQLPVQSNSECQTAFQRFRVTIPETQLCAQYALGCKGHCQSNSGSPLMMPVKTKWYTIGVATLGFNCTEPGFLEIYTRTTEFIDWIKTTAKLQ